jgi:hypothetical protein
LVVIEGDEQSAAGRNAAPDILTGQPHRAGVVQHTPRVHDVEGPERRQVLIVENRARLYHPLSILIAEVRPAQVHRRGNRVWVEVKRDDARAEPARRKTRQAAARAGIEETKPIEIFAAEHGLKVFFRGSDPLVVDENDEVLPVLAEPEAKLPCSPAASSCIWQRFSILHFPTSTHRIFSDQFIYRLEHCSRAFRYMTCPGRPAPHLLR